MRREAREGRDSTMNRKVYRGVQSVGVLCI